MRLEALETLIPDTRIPAAQIIAAAGGTPDEVQGFRQLFGMDSVAMADPAHGAMGYLADLLGRLTPFDASQGPVALFHAHSLPMRADQRLTTAPKVQAALSHLGADRVELIEVDQFNCAGMFYAMASAERMLEAGQITEALIFAGDCLSDWPLAERYLPGCTLLGDGYALLRLSCAPVAYRSAGSPPATILIMPGALMARRRRWPGSTARNCRSSPRRWIRPAMMPDATRCFRITSTGCAGVCSAG